MREWLRDEDLLAQALRRKLLRSLIRAVGVLNSATRGRPPDAESLLCARTLVRLVPRFVTAPEKDEQRHAFSEPEWWTVEKIHGLEAMSREAADCLYESREDAAAIWRTCFDKNGPREGLFQTREQAAEYGRQRYDQWKPTPQPAEEALYEH